MVSGNTSACLVPPVCAISAQNLTLRCLHFPHLNASVEASFFCPRTASFVACSLFLGKTKKVSHECFVTGIT